MTRSSIGPMTSTTTLRSLLLTPGLLLLGNTIAQNTFHRIVDGAYANVEALATDASGNLFAANRYIPDDFESGVQVVKHDPDGNFIWSTVVRDAFTFLDVEDLDVGPDGHAVAVGYNPQTDSAFVVRLSPGGSVLWAKAFLSDLAGNEEARAERVRIAPDGDILVLGTVDRQVNGLGQQDLFLTRLDSLGGVLWNRNIAAPVANTTNRTGDVIVPSTGGILVFGQTALLSEGSWLLQLDDNGAFQWCRRYDTNSASNFVRPMRVFETGTGYQLLYRTAFGSTTEQLHWIATNGQGTVASSGIGQIGMDDAQIQDAVQLNDGSFVLAGHRSEPPVDLDGLLVRLDAAGQVTWSQEYGSAGYELFNAVVETNSGHLLAGGAGEKDSLLLPEGGAVYQSYLVMAEAGGTSYGCEEPSSVTMTPGTYADSTYTLTLGDIAGWVDRSVITTNDYVELAGCPSLSIREGLPSSLHIAPNPARDRVKITRENGPIGLLALFDLQGRQVRSEQVSTASFMLDLSGLPAGVYALVSTTGGHQVVQRVIIDR